MQEGQEENLKEKKISIFEIAQSHLKFVSVNDPF